ncbi:hypothetical protein SPRG_01691 [Saprolegnia parasitica CBS 223.65]|uniref:Uncharacterized protein n=1 Tax=Saprolegnia parasitica (strain CBS 223.65) TaxID=695850 RepID=A0A067D465_SAPPC|nr:hypothetical protein SPRG_01691 [Saprolegnia parasitica CBS 223.65]KDO33812.1 hypothetical protein SPRG_01691 [Saprolegnia parasitica CBS 223.65]|eukprot:XP_012195448.1 hypothetical protein SPRG_01691 [Saprolegnia parasitica CBS 223.65]
MDGESPEVRSLETPTDGSMTERTRGTYGGRQRWLMPGTLDGNQSIASPKKSTSKSKVTAPSVQSFLGTLGIGIGDDLQMVDREANEVAAYRREFDLIRNANTRKEAEIKKIEEALQEASSLLSSRKMDGMAFQTKAINLENRASSIENKLEDELADRGVYSHMIQRLALEVQDAGAMALQTARQEKCTAETTQKKLVKQLQDLRDENSRAIEDMESAIEMTRKKQK